MKIVKWVLIFLVWTTVIVGQPAADKALQEYYYPKVKFIHQVSPQTILHILQTGAWTTQSQEITSAETNNDKDVIPDPHKMAQGENSGGVAGFADINFKKNVRRILDVGGGKFDYCKNYMAKKGIEVLVWDPYNRCSEHNQVIMDQVTTKKVDAATSMAVLNVIAEPESRLAHITTLKESMKIGGYAYFKIWPGQGKLKGTYRPTVNSYGYPGFQANSYIDRFLREVQLVFGLENVTIDPVIFNLIVAKKTSNSPTSLKEIIEIQKLAQQDQWYKNFIKLFNSLVSSRAKRGISGIV